MKKKIPVTVYEEIKGGDVTPTEGSIVNDGGKLYVVTII